MLDVEVRLDNDPEGSGAIHSAAVVTSCQSPKLSERGLPIGAGTPAGTRRNVAHGRSFEIRSLGIGMRCLSPHQSHVHRRAKTFTGAHEVPVFKEFRHW